MHDLVVYDCDGGEEYLKDRCRNIGFWMMTEVVVEEAWMVRRKFPHRVN